MSVQASTRDSTSGMVYKTVARGGGFFGFWRLFYILHDMQIFCLGGERDGGGGGGQGRE